MEYAHVLFDRMSSPMKVVASARRLSGIFVPVLSQKDQFVSTSTFGPIFIDEDIALWNAMAQKWDAFKFPSAKTTTRRRRRLDRDSNVRRRKWRAELARRARRTA